MKKILALFLTAVMLFSILTACSNTDNDQQNDDNDDNDTDLYQPTEPRERVELPEWPPNFNAIDVNLYNSSIIAMPSRAESIESLIDRVTFPYVIQPTNAIRGTVLNKWIEEQPLSTRPDSIATIMVDVTELLIYEVYFGDYNPGDIVIYEQWIGGNMIEMPIGEDFIIFSRSAMDERRNEYGEIIEWIRIPNLLWPMVNIGGIYWLANPYTGRGLSADSNESILTSDSVEIISHPNNPLTLTVEDLLYIVERSGRADEVGGPIPDEIMERVREAVESAEAARAAAR